MLKLVRSCKKDIDFIFEEPPQVGRRPIHEKMLLLAEKGLAGHEMTRNEVQKVCYALLVQLAQMGIGSKPATLDADRAQAADTAAQRASFSLL